MVSPMFERPGGLAQHLEGGVKWVRVAGFEPPDTEQRQNKGLTASAEHPQGFEVQCGYAQQAISAFPSPSCGRRRSAAATAAVKASR